MSYKQAERRRNRRTKQRAVTFNRLTARTRAVARIADRIVGSA